MPMIYLNDTEIDTAINSLEDYIVLVTEEHERLELMEHLKVAIAGTGKLLEVLKRAKKD